MTGLGIGMQITWQCCTFDSVCLCQGHPVAMCALPYGLGYTPINTVCVELRETSIKKEKRQANILG